MEPFEKIDIRYYRPGDATRICALFTQYLPYQRDTEFWVWINRLLGGGSIVSVAECGNQIIGHYGIVPRDFIIDGVRYHAGLGIHAFVAPEFRDKVSIFEISSLAYKEAKRRGLSFLYGFPNANYRFIQEKIEKWKCVSLFNAYELLLKDFNGSDNSEDVSLTKVDRMDCSLLYPLQMLIEQSPESLVSPVIDCRHWLLRYLMHPQHLYELYEVKEREEMMGFVIIKKYRKEDKEYRHIVDYVFSEKADMNKILARIAGTAQEDHADCLSVWKGDSRFEKAIRDMGFKPTGFDTFLGIKILDKTLDETVVGKLTDFSNWRLVMGDTDSF